MNFQGFVRPDGKVGTRNLVLVIPSVGCSQHTAEMIVKGLKGAVYLPNILGCGQIGEDRDIVKRTLVGFALNPNIFASLVVGNGCEQLAPQSLADEIAAGGKRAEVVVIQECGGVRKTVAQGRKIVKEMLGHAAMVSREPVPLSALIVGTECGGSDYTSGLASNPAVGIAADMIVTEGGTVILSETPELIGAEHLLAKRARTPEIAKKLCDVVAWLEGKALEGGQNIREANPSPGNKEGGITTLEEKSLGCIYKAGTSHVEEIIGPAFPPTRKGLVYMDTPANDIEQLTCMVAGGAQIVVFTTGRGTPPGSPIAPVIKITGNHDTYLNMKDAMDMDVSAIIRGKESISSAGRRIFEQIVAAASGKFTKAERLGQRDFCIYKINMNI